MGYRCMATSGQQTKRIWGTDVWRFLTTCNAGKTDLEVTYLLRELSQLIPLQLKILQIAQLAQLRGNAAQPVSIYG